MTMLAAHGYALTSDALEGVDLVARLRAGHRDAIVEAYEAHHEAIRSFARRLVGDDASAEDLVHDVFVELPRAIGRFRGEAPLRTFLLSIAGNLSRKHVRAAIRKRRAFGAIAVAPAPSPRTPEHDAEGAELAAALVRALDELSDEHRLAFVLAEVEERSAGEISAIVGAPEATVRTRLFHAKKKLRELLAKGGHR